MPLLEISTNVSLEGIDTSSIFRASTKPISEILGKPEEYVMVVLKGSVPIWYGGTEEPAASAELLSIGGLTPDANKELSAALASVLEAKLSIPPSRFFLKFYDSQGSNFGWNGTTV